MYFFITLLNEPIAITTLEQELANNGTDTLSDAGDQVAYVPSDESETTTNNHGELFSFDPNTLDAAGFRRLGLQDKTINTLLKYRSKGGHFWKAEDLRKIYGLQKADADRLIPYVQIAGQQQTFAQTAKAQTFYSKSKPAIIDINTATAAQWKALPAIGEVLASRIVKYRDKIGGFTSIDTGKTNVWFVRLCIQGNYALPDTICACGKNCRARQEG